MSEKNHENAVMIKGYAHDGEIALMERIFRRMWIVIIILIVALVGTNTAWIIYESQFAEEVTTIEQQVDTGEAPAVVSGTGDAIYGESNPKSNGPETGGQEQH